MSFVGSSGSTAGSFSIIGSGAGSATFFDFLLTRDFLIATAGVSIIGAASSIGGISTLLRENLLIVTVGLLDIALYFIDIF
jgi:hypothetical protein